MQYSPLSRTSKPGGNYPWRLGLWVPHWSDSFLQCTCPLWQCAYQCIQFCFMFAQCPPDCKTFAFMAYLYENWFVYFECIEHVSNIRYIPCHWFVTLETLIIVYVYNVIHLLWMLWNMLWIMKILWSQFNYFMSLIVHGKCNEKSIL
jgi:hypothetical protein